MARAPAGGQSLKHQVICQQPEGSAVRSFCTCRLMKAVFDPRSGELRSRGDKPGEGGWGQNWSAGKPGRGEIRI